MKAIEVQAILSAVLRNKVKLSRNINDIKIENYFPPYKAAIDAGAMSVMTSFNELDGIPAT